MNRGEITYRLVSTLEDTEVALSVCRQIWGADAIRDTDLYYVAAMHGGYFGIASVDGQPVGASFGLLSDHGRGLHSHMAGVIKEFAGTGVGRGLKNHQRSWAASEGIETITWTFDPLIRRNAWFNLVRLGVTVTDYRVNYYGALGDEINGDDESDRLMVSWPTMIDPRSGVSEPIVGDLLIETPPDIESIRPIGTDSLGRTARELRVHMRAELGDRIGNGWRIVGLTSDYRYVLRQNE
jgi:predicted GNAT superfamily acetyltransferase